MARRPDFTPKTRAQIAYYMQLKRRFRQHSADDTPAFTPAIIFAASEPGVWLDPSDPATLFSDTAGTTQAGIGDPVALVLDKSGNGNHVTQPTLASRPILREADGLRYLEFDGVDDFMVTAAITPGTDKTQTVAGITRLRDSPLGIVCGLSARMSDNGATALRSPWTTLPGHGFTARGTEPSTTSAADDAAPQTNIVTGTADISAPVVTFRVNGSQLDQSTASMGTGNFLTHSLYIGARDGGDQLFEGHIYSVIIRFGPNLDISDLQELESYVAKRTGVQL